MYIFIRHRGPETTEKTLVKEVSVSSVPLWQNYHVILRRQEKRLKSPLCLRNKAELVPEISAASSEQGKGGMLMLEFSNKNSLCSS